MLRMWVAPAASTARLKDPGQTEICRFLTTASAASLLHISQFIVTRAILTVKASTFNLITTQNNGAPCILH